MVAGRVHHWKHGWIPISPEAKRYVAGLGPRPGTKLALSDNRSRTIPLEGFDALPARVQKKITDRLESMTGMSEPELSKRVQGNLDEAFKNGPKSELKWYLREAQDIGDQADIIRAQYHADFTDQQILGMAAVTSAHVMWKENKKLALNTAVKLAADEPFVVTAPAIQSYNDWVKKRKSHKALPVDIEPGTYRPSQLPSDFVASQTPGMPRTINGDAMIDAVRIYRGELSVDEAIRGPKQRSFVNNLTEPDDGRFATIDTWQYRAMMQGIALKREFGKKGNRRTFNYTLDQWEDMDLAVADGRANDYGYDPSLGRYHPDNKKRAMDATVSPQEFFQSGPISKPDNYDYGTYPWFVKQVQMAARRYGVSPSALQAVTWVAAGGGH